VQDYSNLSAEDLITEEDMVVTMSHEGYVKTQPLSDYKAQRRGGRGKSATATKENDFVEKLIIANTHDTILCFSSAGKVYWLRVFNLPVASRASRGKPFVNLLPLEEGEKINAMLPVREYSEDKFVFMATASGTVKKTPLTEFAYQLARGKIAIDLRENDTLVGVALTDGQQNVLLFSSDGKAVCFNETDVRSMGRTAAGVRGIRLQDGQKVISLIISAEGTPCATAGPSPTRSCGSSGTTRTRRCPSTPTGRRSRGSSPGSGSSWPRPPRAASRSGTSR
jgi:DNA gyrase subunit A